MPFPRKYAIVAKGTGWRKELAERKVLWATRNLDDIHQEIENYVYDEAMNGARLSDLAVQFGVPRIEFEKVYGDVWRLGSAEMRSVIVNDQLAYGLKSNQPVAKIWLGKTLGGLAEGGQSSEVSDVGGDVNIRVNVVRSNDGTET